MVDYWDDEFWNDDEIDIEDIPSEKLTDDERAAIEKVLYIFYREEIKEINRASDNE